MSKLSDLLDSAPQNKPTANKQNTSTKRSKLQTLLDAIANNDQNIIQQYNNTYQETMRQNTQTTDMPSGIPDFKNLHLPKSDMDIYYSNLGKNFDVYSKQTSTPLPESASYQKAQTLKSDINKLTDTLASIDNEKNAMQRIIGGILNPSQYLNRPKSTALNINPMSKEQISQMQADFKNASYGNLSEMQKQYDDLVNSDDYVQDNMQRWLALINKTDPLTNEERDEAKAAIKILNTLIFKQNIEGLKNFDFTNKGHNLEYGRLRELLGSKASAPTSFTLGVGSSVPFMNKYFKEGYQSTVKYNDFGNPELQKAAENADILANAQANNPIAFTAGNITGTVAQMELGGVALKGLGVTSQAARNAIVMGSFNGLHSLANSDDALTVAANTAAGAAGGYLGSKVGELVGKGVAQKLASTGLNYRSIGAIYIEWFIIRRDAAGDHGS